MVRDGLTISTLLTLHGEFAVPLGRPRERRDGVLELILLMRDQVPVLDVGIKTVCKRVASTLIQWPEVQAEAP